MHTRCIEMLQEIVQKHPHQRVLIVTHGGVLHHWHRYIEQGASKRFTNASISILNHDAEQSPQWTVEQWNSTAHLQK